MPFSQVLTSAKEVIRPARISRSIVAILVFSLIQSIAISQAPISYALPGTVGSGTGSGSCASTVDEPSYVTDSFVATSGFCIIKFNSGTTWTVPSGVVNFDVLLVGGGGGGGADGGGGGGGGGVGTVSGISVTAGNVATITVGSGGNGVIHTPGTAGSSGGTSSLVINGNTYNATGGSVAGGYSSGENYAAAGSVSSNVTSLISGTIGRGGRNSIQGPGGVGGVGSDGPTTAFTGSSLTFAGGGGGGTCAPGYTAENSGGILGGAGGGGRGSRHIKNDGSDAGQPGINGLGGGGGGGSACDDGPGSAYGGYQRTAGGNGGKGVVYIKYVPYIFLASDPQPVTAAIGATATFTSIPFQAITGPARTKKWQVLTPGGTWADISGATGSDSYTTPTITRSMQRNQYRYIVTDTVGTAVSSTASVAATLTVSTPQTETDTALAVASSGSTGNTTSAGADEITPGSGDSFTIEAWIYPTANCTSRCTILARESAFRFTYYNNKISFVLWNGSSYVWQDVAAGFMPINQWAHVALTRNGTSIKVYVNGTSIATYSITYAPGSNLGTNFYLGSISNATEQFSGSIDELKIWKTDRGSLIASDMNSNETSTSALVGYWNFNEGTSSTAYNQVTTATAGTDFALTASNYWNSIVVSSASTSGVYTTRTFYRSIITAFGGWKAPATLQRASVLVVGGGGGGGGQGYLTDPGGGGGGGGVYEINSYPLTSGKPISIIVGAGGLGGAPVTPNQKSIGRIGGSTTFDQMVAGGGGGATYDSGDTTINASGGLAGGGGGGASYYWNATTYGAGGTGTPLTIGGVTYPGRTGGNASGYSGSTSGGGGGASSDTSGASSGVASASKPGAGVTSSITGITYGRGGIGGGGTSYTFSSPAAFPGNGGDGYSSSTPNGGFGVNGANGLVVVKYITAAAPTYTKPTTAYLNVGMTETFTTNVAVDSATVGLTRTFKWESTTPTANGAYTLIKQGTGAANASFSWFPTDTSTSGSGYQYRLTVTDSDTAGLFITDSSTAYAVINQALVVSGSSSFGKRINLAKSETYTITLGTPTYRATMSPNIAGISLDTSTAGFAVIKISETMTVGTYYETLTVIDSVSASVVTPLIIKVTPPPSFSATAEQVDSGTVLYFDTGNSSSLNPAQPTVLKDMSGRGLQANFQPLSMPAQRSGPDTCTAASYSNQYLGVLNFATDTCGYVPNVGTSNLTYPYTYQAWVKRNGDWGTSSVDDDYTSIITTPWNGSSQIGLTLHWRHALNSADYYLEAGIWGNPTWYSAKWATPIETNTWVFVTVTLSVDAITISINNGTPVSMPAIAITKTSIDSGLLIGKRFDSNANYYFNGSLASFRLYNRILTASEITQNYNATKDRFLSANIDLAYPSKKYGASTTETYTITSGYGPATVSYATGNKTGVRLETTTSLVTLKMQESLTVTTHLETITVTDSLGASTYLPITMAVSQADTITVQVRNPVTMVYTGNAPATLPTVTVVGLVSSDVATTSRLYSSPAGSPSCATGGTCNIGDTGPGGGKVFYDAGSNQSWGRYLEAAPSNWTGTVDSATANVGVWCKIGAAAMSNSANVGTLANGLGQGYANTYASTLDQCTGGAIYSARQYRGGGLSDWYVPSADELTIMGTNTSPNFIRTSIGLVYSASLYGYWGSNINIANGTVGSLVSVGQAWSIGATNRDDSTHNMLRPIRAFSPASTPGSFTYSALVNSSTVPTQVENYVVSASTLNFTSGASSNYVNIVYETSTLTITKAAQSKLGINYYGAVAGSAYTLYVDGGSGDGALNYAIGNGSSATNCRITGSSLANDNSASDQKACNVVITKALSRNYFTETLTATIYFIAYIPTNNTVSVGSGSTIALQGANAMTRDTELAPQFTSMSASSGAIGSSLTIRGVGFYYLDQTKVEIEFGNRVTATSYTLVDDSTITVTVPAGAGSDLINIITPKGLTATTFFTVTP